MIPVETWQWIALFGIVAVSALSFVAVSIWAWRDNVLLFRHIVERSQYYSRRARRRVRMWRDTDYRAYAELTDRYEGSVLLMHSLHLREQACRELHQTADDDKARRFFGEQFHAYRDARLKCQPHVVEVLADLDDIQIESVACYLSGVDYDPSQHASVTPEQVDEIQKVRDVVSRQIAMVRSNPDRVIDAIQLLSEISEDEDE